MTRNKCEFRWLTVATAVAVCLPFSSLATDQPATHAGVNVLREITEQDIAALPPMITQQQYESQAQATLEMPSVLKSLAEMDNQNASAVAKPQAEASPPPQTQPVPAVTQPVETHLAAKPTESPVFARSSEPPVTATTSEAPLFSRKTETPAPVSASQAPVLAKSIEPPVTPITTEAPLFSRKTETPVAVSASQMSVSAKNIEHPATTITTTEAPLFSRKTETPVAVSTAKTEAVAPRTETPATRDRLNALGNSTVKAATESGTNQAALKKNYDFFPSVQQYYQPDPAYNNVRWNGEIEGESGKRAPTTATAADFKNHSTSPSRAFLQQMVSMALTHSPEIRSSEADVLAAGYQIDQTKGQRWPQVQFGIATPLSNQGSSSNTRYNSKISDTSGSVTVTTPVYDWGKISSQVGNAEESMNAAINAQNYTKEQLAYSTISELMNLSRYQENRKVALAYVERMKQLAYMLEQITAADKGRASEYTQAKAKLLSARASLDDIEHQVSTSRIKLVRLLGVEPNLPPNISWQDSVMPSSVALAALSKNPNLLKLQAQVRAAEHEAESIQAAGLPQLNWVVSKNTAKDSNGDQTGWYTGLNVQWNAFSGGSQKAAQMAARAKANGAQQQYEVAYRDLEYQINNMIQTRDSSFMRADDFDRLSVETDRVRQMFYDQWYNLGKRTLLDVLTAENDHFNNQMSAVNNRFDGYISNTNVIASAAMLLSWVGQ